MFPVLRHDGFSMQRLIKYFVFILLTSTSPVTSLFAGTPPEPDARLVRTVIFSRHGVRSPTQNDATLKQWANRAWPRWPVKPGNLTERGKALVSAQWTALKPLLTQQGLLPAAGCPAADRYQLVADEDERTRETAIAIFEGLAPGCRIQPQYGTRYDLLFHPDAARYRTMDRRQAVEEVQSRLDALEKDPAMMLALNRLQAITACCKAKLCRHQVDLRQCTLPELPTRLSIDSTRPKLDISGKWPMASSLAEIMLLEYAEWPGKKAGWGTVDETVLRQIVPLHDRVFDATHRPPILARAGGTHLLKHIRDVLLSDSSPALNVLVGHDTNIAYLGGLFGIDWSVPGQGTNPIPPGSFLSFELWEKPDGTREVRIHFNAPTFETLHTQPAPVVSPVQVPVSDPVYDVESFSARVTAATGL